MSLIKRLFERVRAESNRYDSLVDVTMKTQIELIAIWDGYTSMIAVGHLTGGEWWDDDLLLIARSTTLKTLLLLQGKDFTDDGIDSFCAIVDKSLLQLGTADVKNGAVSGFIKQNNLERDEYTKYIKSLGLIDGLVHWEHQNMIYGGR